MKWRFIFIGLVIICSLFIIKEIKEKIYWRNMAQEEATNFLSIALDPDSEFYKTYLKDEIEQKDSKDSVRRR